MPDGMQDVIAQIALIVTAAAVLTGILGWLVGSASGKRRAAKALASTSASRPQPAAAPTAAPSPAVFEATAPVIEAVPVAAATDASAPADPEPMAFAPFAPEPVAPAYALVAEPVAAPIAYVPTHAFTEPSDSYLDEEYEEDDDDDDDPDPDRTVLRPAPSFGSATTAYVPARFSVVTPTLSEPEPTTVVPASVQEIQELLREVRAKELELGALEAGALSAWDRTVPALEAKISALQDENDSLRRQIREADERSDADARTVERLRSLVAERDSRLAEIRAQS